MNRFDPQPTNSESSSQAQATGQPWNPAPSPQEELPTAQEMKERAIQKTAEVTETAKAKTSAMLDEQKVRAADVLGDICSAVRRGAEELEHKDHPQASHYMDVVADRVDTFSQNLRERDVNYFLERTQDFARRRPAVFIGGALALGFLAIRFLKSTSSSRSTERFASDIQGYGKSTQSQGERISEGVHTDTPVPTGTQFTI